MSRKAFYIGIFLASLAGGMLALGIFSVIVGNPNSQPSYNSISKHQEVALTSLEVKDIPDVIVPDGLNFVNAANKATKAVVHIKSKYEGVSSVNGFFRYRTIPSAAKGSGVIISDDGYIVTNYHVINGANSVEVTLHDNRRYEATVIGVDPTTDLALIKINETGLNFLPYGDSDKLQIGEWVLAVGNPFDLNSTVTAGIVSAKARNINILTDENRLEIESFIQTDAVVNPGNSGGALVDLTGNLVGVNTAIATQTGTYSGYSFAVPVTLVKKVMDDLLEFGVVQRGLLGVMIRDAALQSQIEDLDVLNGVYIITVNENSAAEEAELKSGDIIVGINGRQVKNTSELQELVARNRPGDEVEVTYIRDGIEKTVIARLRKFDGTTDVVDRPEIIIIEGATFKNNPESDSRKLGIYGGVKITDIQSGKWKEAGIKEGFIITKIDKTRVRNVNELRIILESKVGERINILGISVDGERTYYSMKW